MAPLRIHFGSILRAGGLLLAGLAAVPQSVMAQPEGPATADRWEIWIGGRTGIHHVILDGGRQRLLEPRQVSTRPGAGFLAWHPTSDRLLATATESGEGGIASYQVQGRGNQSSLVDTGFVASGDGGAACVAVDHQGRLAFSAQYGGGSVASYRLNQQGDVLERLDLVEHGPGSEVDARRQAAAHPHWVGMSPKNRWLCVPDLGMDAVVVYSVDWDSGKLTESGKVATAAGAGPRHMKFHRQRPLAWVLNELKLTVEGFQFDETQGSWKRQQTIASLPEALRDSQSNTAAEIRIHPNGRFVYTSNRGHDTITVFAIDRQDGMLSEVQREPVRGSWPRNFAIDPSGRWLVVAGQRSNTVALFRVDPENGRLEFARSVVNVPDPTCVLFEKTR